MEEILKYFFKYVLVLIIILLKFVFKFKVKFKILSNKLGFFYFEVFFVNMDNLFVL